MSEQDFEAASASLVAVLVTLNRTAPERVMTSAFCAEAVVRSSMPEQPLLTQSRHLFATNLLHGAMIYRWAAKRRTE